MDTSDKDTALLCMRNIPKLISKEGGEHFHVHRYLGLLTLMSYSYRIFLRYRTGDPFNSNAASPKVIATVALHMALSWTSLLFRIPKRRHRSLPMIYPEFRWHSILFACRSFVAMIWVIVCIELDVGTNNWVSKGGRIAIVWSTLVAADMISNHYKKIALLSGDDSAMRGMPFPKEWSVSTQTMFTACYSSLQFMATAAVLVNSNQYTLLVITFPVQFAAFLMTCVRKGIITSKGWHIYYSLSFLVALSSISHWRGWIKNFLFGFVLYSVRRYGHVNKYLLWLIVTCFLSSKKVSPAGSNPYLTA